MRFLLHGVISQTNTKAKHTKKSKPKALAARADRPQNRNVFCVPSPPLLFSDAESSSRECIGGGKRNNVNWNQGFALKERRKMAAAFFSSFLICQMQRVLYPYVQWRWEDGVRGRKEAKKTLKCPSSSSAYSWERATDGLAQKTVVFSAHLVACPKGPKMIQSPPMPIRGKALLETQVQ